MTPSATAEQIFVDNYDVNAMSQVDTNPLEVRWGINPVQRNKILDARVTGISIVPFARFFPIRSFKSPRERHSIDWTQPREELEIIPAEEAQRAIEDSLSGKNAQVTTDWGLRVGFVGERDIAKMEVLTQTLLPALSTIRLICEDHGLAHPISDVCEGSDGEFGERDTCITCWNRWINSTAIIEYAQIVASQGLPVTERDNTTGEHRNRIVRPTIDEMEAGLEMIQIAFRTGISSLQLQWETIVRESEKNERKPPTPFEDTYRRDLHANRPEDRQIALVERMARATAGNQAPATDPNLLAQLAQSTLMTQQMMAMFLQQNPQMAGMAQNFANQPQTAETPAPVENEPPPVNRGGRPKKIQELENNG